MGLSLLRKVNPLSPPVGLGGTNTSRGDMRKIKAELSGHVLCYGGPAKKHGLVCIFTKGCKTKTRHLKLMLGLDKPNRQKKGLNRDHKLDVFYFKRPASEVVKQFGVSVY